MNLQEFVIIVHILKIKIIKECLTTFDAGILTKILPKNLLITTKLPSLHALNCKDKTCILENSEDNFRRSLEE